MNHTELKVGFVGFGGAALAQYRAFHLLDGCRVTAVYDPRPGGRTRARNLSPTLFITDDFDAFLNSGIDIVSVCSPDRTHAEYMARSLAAGKHVISEKPLTDALEGCQTILHAEQQAPDCVAAVQHQMRFLPIHQEMKRIIRRGELGKISYIEGYYVHNLTTRANAYDTWRFEDNATPLVYSGCHFVDLLRWLLDDEVVEVAGMANHIAFPDYPESDCNVILLRFRSGIIGKVITAFGAGRPQDHAVRVYGTEKSIENNLLFTRDNRHRVFIRPDPFQTISGERNMQRAFLEHNLNGNHSLKHRASYMLRGLQALAFGHLFEQLGRRYKELPDYAISNYPLRLYEHGFAVVASLNNFVEAIRTRTRPLCTVTDSAKTVATCLAGVESYRTGRFVAMDAYWLPEFAETPSIAPLAVEQQHALVTTGAAAP
ncbi:MAG: Gfo/Idh/MocA family oxidoreductase [Chloroflexaceae bacterium]|nr:Gfo/Idh/MocA family oxidoreductase [Chloroflexaceae bacterium]